MKIIIEIEETHPRYTLVQAALTRPLDGPGIIFAEALQQARDWAEVFRLSQFQKIEAVKKVRAMTSLGLREAKDLVESL